MSVQFKNRFSNPTALTNSTLILGVPFERWDKVFVGNCTQNLKDVERRVKEVYERNPNAAIDLIRSIDRESNDNESS